MNGVDVYDLHLTITEGVSWPSHIILWLKMLKH